MKILLQITALVMCFSSQVCYAVDEAILAEYSRKVAAQVCTGNTDWLRCYGLDPLNCQSHSQDIIDQCMQEHVLNRDEPVQFEAEVHIISQQLHTCIRGSFSQKFDSQKKDSPECKGLE